MSQLLSAKQFAEYINVSQRKAYDLLNDENCEYCVRIGGRIFAHRELLDIYLKKKAKYHL